MAVTVNILTIRVFPYNPRSKIERGLLCNMMIINRLTITHRGDDFREVVSLGHETMDCGHRIVCAGVWAG